MAGGLRAGAGRKPKTDEQKVRGLAIKSIKDRYGSEGEGFEALLASGEPALIKWVFEHAYGKPKERLELSGALTNMNVDVTLEEAKELRAKLDEEY